MPPPAPIDADEVHILDAGQAPKGRWGLGLVLLVLGGMAAAGAWVVLADPFAESTSRLPPAPAADNLLRAAWSFEAGPETSPAEFWTTPVDAPAGFAFVAEAAVSGAMGAQAQLSDEGWCRWESRDSWRVDNRDRVVELAGEATGPGLQLLLIFETLDGTRLETVVASGAGALVGRATAPPGFHKVRVGLGCVGPGSVDDLSLRMVSAESDNRAGNENHRGQVREIGVFEIVIGDPQGVSLFRGQDLVLRVEPLALAGSDGRSLPPSAAQLPGRQALAFPDGSSVGLRTAVREEAQRLVLTEQLTGLPAQTKLIRHGVVRGALAAAPVGVRSSRGYERFVGDFQRKNVQALLLGRTQDRLGFTADQPFDISVTHRADGTVGLIIERVASGDVTEEISIQASFHEERVLAAGLADGARDAERQGELGRALAQLGQIIEDFPFDEGVLARALADRARLGAAVQSQLDRLQADLEDALFLGSAQRCVELRDEALALAEIYAGSSLSERFAEQARAVDTAGAQLIAESQARLRHRLQAQLQSFEAHGGYPGVSAELIAELALSPTVDAPLPSEEGDSP
ncbi:MAG: hypothetical protein ACI9EF_002766 [Pseudohongiellaceae bacterium]